VPNASPHILLIGRDQNVAQRIGSISVRRNWKFTNLGTLGEASRVIRNVTLEAVLAFESLDDGRGYDLSSLIACRNGSLYVGVPLSEDYLWLPVVRSGRKVLGERAVAPSDISLEIDNLISGGIRGDKFLPAAQSINNPSPRVLRILESPISMGSHSLDATPLAGAAPTTNKFQLRSRPRLPPVR
jgi:hypothetical protein